MENRESLIAARVAKKLVAGQYADLNDAAEFTGNDGLARGSTEIWYMKNDFFREGSMGFEWMQRHGTLPDPQHLDNTHVMLGKVRERDPDRVFSMMQGEVWSPKGEARSLVRGKGIGHTSMSVGDIIVVGSGVHIVDRMGFERLPKKT